MPSKRRPPPESAEETLRASEARLRAILAAALDAIITIDQDGHVLEFNPAAEQMFGYTRDEALGREMAELIVPPHLREWHREGVRRSVTSGKDKLAGKRIEITAMRKGGEEFPVELAISRIPLADGPPFFTGHIRDITARQAIERRQAAQLAVTRVLAESATLAEATPRLLQAVCEELSWDLGAIWNIDPGSESLRCVDLWHVPGLELHDFIEVTRGRELARGVGLPGRIWAEQAPVWVEDAPQAANFPRFSVALRCGLRGAFGFPIRLGEEMLGVVEFFSRATRKPDADLLAMFDAIGSQLGQFIQRRRSESALASSEHRWRLLFEQSPMSVQIFDAKGKVRAANKAWEKLWDTPVEQGLSTLR